MGDSIRTVQALSPEQLDERPGENAEVQPQGPVIHVPDVEFDALCPRWIVASVDPCPAGHTRFDFQATPLARCIAVSLVG